MTRRFSSWPQKDVDDPDPTPENLCTVGTIANIRQVMNLPGDNLRVLVEGKRAAN